jgi:predicted S18 family serine protease
VDKRTYDKAIDMFCAAHEAELKTKDEEIEKLKQFLENLKKGVQEYDELVNRTTDELWDMIKVKDERITELEAMVQKMKCCDNCNELPCDTGVGISTAVQMLQCQENNFCLWRLKGTK